MEIPIVIKTKAGYKQVSIGEITALPTLAYILGKDGVYISDSNPAHTSITKAELSIAEDMEESLAWSYPTISYPIYIHALNFFRKIFNEYKSEGCILLTLNRNQPIEDQQYEILVPKQRVGGASVKYDAPKLDNGTFLAGSIHSHPDFGASQSGIDLSDELNFDGIHITLGHVDRPSPEIHQRLMIRGTAFVTKENLIETVPNVGIITPVDEWMNQVEKIVYAGCNYDWQKQWSEEHGKKTTMSGTTGNFTKGIGMATDTGRLINSITAEEILALMEPE